MTKAKPILFSAPMIRALLDGRKSQTRRILKPQPGDMDRPFQMDHDGSWHVADSQGRNMSPLDVPSARGHLLYVREAFWQSSRYPFTMPCGGASPQRMNWGSRIQYAADGEPENTPNRHYPEGLKGGAIAAPDPDATWVKRPSIHMPRRISRLTLEVTEVRVERLQDISEEDAEAEGVELRTPPPGGLSGWRDYGDKPGDMTRRYFSDPRRSFSTLWNSLHGPDAWGENRWVAAISFRTYRYNVDELLRERGTAE